MYYFNLFIFGSFSEFVCNRSQNYEVTHWVVLQMVFSYMLKQIALLCFYKISAW